MIWKRLFPLRNDVFQRTKLGAFRNLSVNAILRKDHYEVLGISYDATPAEIKNAYFELSKIYHPDRIEATEENLNKFREITNAYEILGNEQSRKLYDRGILKDSTSLITEEEVSKDPILKFYKDRQEKITKKDSDTSWSQEFYKSHRKRVYEKAEIYRLSKQNFPEFTYPVNRVFFIFMSSAVFWIFYYAEAEGHPIQELLKNIKADYLSQWF